MPARRTIVNRVNLLAALTPAAVWVVLVAIASSVYLRLGRWPTGMDPQTLVPTFMSWLFIATVWALALGLPAWLFTTGGLLVQRRWKLAIIRSLIFWISLSLLILVFRHDPTMFTDWFID